MQLTRSSLRSVRAAPQQSQVIEERSHIVDFAAGLRLFALKWVKSALSDAGGDALQVRLVHLRAATESVQTSTNGVSAPTIVASNGLAFEDLSEIVR